jgi:hypothetical protein
MNLQHNEPAAIGRRHIWIRTDGRGLGPDSAGNTYTTKSGKTLTDVDIEQLGDKAAATGYDLEARATADQTATTDVIRQALRRFLHVA